MRPRTFQRLGRSEDHRFRGKVIAATNRALGRELAEGRFRADLYYRLCSDTVAAPALAERLADSPRGIQPFPDYVEVVVLRASS